MKISVFYEHIEKACEQTKKPLEEVLEHVKKSGIDGIEMDYDMLSSEDDEQSILTSLKKAGLVISSIYGFCHLDSDPEEQKCLDVIDQAAKMAAVVCFLCQDFSVRQMQRYLESLQMIGKKQ